MRADEKPVSHYAKANEVIAYTSKCGEEIKCVDIDYINQLRVERLMAKADYYRLMMSNYVDRYTMSQAVSKHTRKKFEKCKSIAEALEARARRIKEGM